MDNANPTDPMAASFDLATRQDKTEADVAVLRSDVDEVRPASTRSAVPPPAPPSKAAHPPAWK